MAPRIPAPDPGVFAPWVGSFAIHLRSEQKSPNTVRGYVDAATRFAGWLLANTDVRNLAKVKPEHIKRYRVWMGQPAREEGRPEPDGGWGAGYALGYQGNQHRNLQQFFRWYAAEEDVPNVYLGLKPPPMDRKLVPVLTHEQLSALIKDAEAKKDFGHRRDAAILRLFACSGARLSEISGLDVTDVDLADRSARVHGKGRKDRRIKFDHRATQALDRYLRVRAAHPSAYLSALWLGVRRRNALTPSGVYQLIERRGQRLGIDLHPHMFRHTFSHHWLDNGGAEGDLMELNGWDSPQMLRRYGASARAARAQRAYDRVDVMGGI
jgi:site-specific recombinase XerD